MKEKIEGKVIDRETKIMLLKALGKGKFEPSDIEKLCEYLDLKPQYGFKGFNFLPYTQEDEQDKPEAAKSV